MPAACIVTQNPALRAAVAEQLAQAGWECADAPDAVTLVDADTVPASPGARAIGLGRAPNPAYAVFLRLPLRLEELLRRMDAAAAAPGEAPLRVAANWLYHPRERRLQREDGESGALLTEKEGALLHALLAASGTICPRQELLAAIWNYGGDIATHTLETHLYRLRAKLKEAGLPDDAILTTPEGYGIRA